MNRVRVLTTEQLAELPKPAYLLHPFIVDRGVTVLFGASGTYKSFVAIDWSMRSALDENGSVVYVAAEGAATLQRRVAAWCEHSPGGDIRIACAPPSSACPPSRSPPCSAMHRRQRRSGTCIWRTGRTWNAPNRWARTLGAA